MDDSLYMNIETVTGLLSVPAALSISDDGALALVATNPVDGELVEQVLIRQLNGQLKADVATQRTPTRAQVESRGQIRKNGVVL